MVLKCKFQVNCEYCKTPIKVGDWMQKLAIDNHNMGYTHKIVIVHDECTNNYLKY